MNRCTQILTSCAALLLGCLNAAAQKVDTAYVWKYDLYDQTSTAAPRYSGSILSAGFQMFDPIAVVSSANTLISGPGYFLTPAGLSNSGLTVSESTFSFQTRELLNQRYPNGTIRFQYRIPAVFDGSIELTGDRYPAAPQVTNFTALQAVADQTAIVEWARAPTAAPGDVIMVSVRDSEEIFSTVAVGANGVADHNATMATLIVPPGQSTIGTITITRPTASAETAEGKLVAGYATSTTFPIRSVGARDNIAPQIISRTPAIDAVGVSPTAPINLVFDEPMRTRGRLRGATSPNGQRERLTWSADQRSVSIRYPAPLPAGPVTLTFDGDFSQSFKDISDNRIPGGTVAASFFVGNLPVFTVQPASRTPESGSPVTLTGNAIWPLGGISYQWLLDGVAVAGATNPTLSIPSFQMAQSGLYELRASNANGATFSAPAVVAIDAIRYLPHANLQVSVEANQASNGEPITPGLPLTLNVRMETGTTASSAQWRKNGEAIPGATRMTLDIPSVREADSGYYDVLLINEYGAASPAGYRLNVQAGAPLPKYSAFPQYVVVTRGTNAVLNAFVQPAFGFVRGWQFNGVTLPAGGSAPTLSLPDVTPGTAGVYRYFVSNGREMVIAAELIVSVRESVKAPAISIQPRDVFFSEDGGGSTGFSYEGEAPFVFQWRKNGVDVPGATSSGLIILANRLEQAGTYACLVRNAYGSTETRPIDVRFRLGRVAPEKPRIISLSNHILVVGGYLSLSSQSDFSSGQPTTFEWRRNGITVPSGGTSLQVANLRVTDAGSYTVVYGNSFGASESDPVQVRVLDAAQPPEVVAPKTSITARLGERVSLEATVVASGNLRYRWFVNGREVTGENATSAPGTFLIGSVQPAQAGAWSVEVSNAAGTATAAVADLVLAPEPPSSAHLSNVSTRATAGQGNATLIVGFGIGGNQPKRMLLRAVGPPLRGLGVSNPVSNPRLVVYRGDTVVATNDDWFHQSGISSLLTAQRVAGAFSLNVNDGDAALVATLDPGSYTLQYGNDGAAAIGLIEAYDLDPGFAPSRLVNLSSRLFVGPGEQAAIPGLIVTGVGTRTYLIRAIGPGLRKFGVGDVLNDPMIVLKAGNGSFASFSNDDWEKALDPNALVQAARRVGAFALDSGSKDAALLATLAPGSYTALVSGSGNSSGIALIEVYEIP